MHIGVYLFLRTAGPTISGVSLLVGAVVLRKHKCFKVAKKSAVLYLKAVGLCVRVFGMQPNTVVRASILFVHLNILCCSM